MWLTLSLTALFSIHVGGWMLHLTSRGYERSIAGPLLIIASAVAGAGIGIWWTVTTLAESTMAVPC